MSWRKIAVRPVALVVVAVWALAFAANASASSREQIIRPFAPLSTIGNDTVASSNWSGYAVQSNLMFTDVQASWKQPASTCSSSGATYASFWVGIDGYSSDSVEQLGTDSDCNGPNSPAYYAWWELYPAGQAEISPSKYPVKPGDTLAAEVSVSNFSFTLKLASSEGWSYSTTLSDPGVAESSAEVIAESPEVCTVSRRRETCSLASLTNFGTINFTGAEAAVSGASADAAFSTFTADSGPHDIIAETSNGTVKAQPSSLSASPPPAAGNAFSITWHHS